MTNPSDHTDDRQKFEAHLLERASKSRIHARKNDLAADLCYLVAVVGSFSATLCAAFGDLPRGLIAAISAIPGTALLANSVFSFEKKSQWHRRRKLKYDAFAMRLRYESADVAEVSKELREFEEKIDQDYPRFGTSGNFKKAED